MSDVLARGATWFGGKLKGFAGRTVTYARGAESVSVTATAGRSDHQQVEPESGYAVEFESRDYVFDVTQTVAALGITFSAWLATLTGGEQPHEPQPADVITDGDLTCEVMRIAQGPCFRFSDPDQTLLRVHTKVVEEA